MDASCVTNVRNEASVEFMKSSEPTCNRFESGPWPKNSFLRIPMARWIGCLMDHVLSSVRVYVYLPVLVVLASKILQSYPSDAADVVSLEFLFEDLFHTFAFSISMSRIPQLTLSNWESGSHQASPQGCHPRPTAVSHEPRWPTPEPGTAGFAEGGSR